MTTFRNNDTGLTFPSSTRGEKWRKPGRSKITVGADKKGTHKENVEINK